MAREDTGTVREFFENWALYKKIVRDNYLHHDQVYRRLGRFVRERFKQPFSVLDLGCGDAARMADVLAGTPVARYTGVDLSKTALELAEKDMEAVSCDKRFIPGDYLGFVDDSALHTDIAGPADLIWVGLSLHHLPEDRLGEFFTACRALLAPGGRLLVYEPMRRDDESRPEYLERCRAYYRKHWTDLTQDELERSLKHVSVSDFQHPAKAYRKTAGAAGFASVDVLYISPDELFGMLLFAPA